MEIICVNASFSEGNLDFFEKFGVKIPEKNKMYNIREVIKLVNGKTGILLEELVNPEVPIKHPILGFALKEPNWDLLRFRKLSGDTISKEEIRELITELKTIENDK